MANMLKNINLTKYFEGSLQYPKDYNPRVHGPYNPAVYYGPKDTAFSEVKLGEVSKWFSRRNMSLKAASDLVVRAAWRYRMKYVLPKRAGPALFFHTALAIYLTGYIFNEYGYRSQHTWAKYH